MGDTAKLRSSDLVSHVDAYPQGVVAVGIQSLPFLMMDGFWCQERIREADMGNAPAGIAYDAVAGWGRATHIQPTPSLHVVLAL